MSKPLNYKTIPVLLLFLCHSALFTSVGMIIVLFPTLLLKNNVNEFLIGLSASIELIASVITPFMISKFTKKWGVFKVLWTMVALFSITIFTMFFYQNYGLWCVLIAILGFNLFGSIIIIQSLFHQWVENHNRGKIMAILSMFICAGLTVGPIIVKALEGNTQIAFAIAALSSLLVIPLSAPLIKRYAQLPKTKSIKLSYFLRRAPIVFIAKFIHEFIVNGFFTFTVVYLVLYNYSPTKAGLALSALTASAILDLPIGMLVDKFNPIKLIHIAMLGIAIGMGLLFPVVLNFTYVIALYFVIGLFFGVVYLSASAWVNNRFHKRAVVSANATLQLMGSLGGIFGAALVGLCMKADPRFGFPLSIIGVIGIYFITAFIIKKPTKRELS